MTEHTVCMRRWSEKMKFMHSCQFYFRKWFRNISNGVVAIIFELLSLFYNSICVGKFPSNHKNGIEWIAKISINWTQIVDKNCNEINCQLSNFHFSGLYVAKWIPWKWTIFWEISFVLFRKSNENLLNSIVKIFFKLNVSINELSVSNQR